MDSASPANKRRTFAAAREKRGGQGPFPVNAMPDQPESIPATAALPWDRLVTEIARAQPGLRAFLRTLLPCPGDADDVLQNTNLVLWQKRAEYDAQRPFGPWARRMAYFQTLAFLKSRSRARESSFSEELLEHLAADSDHAMDTLERRLKALGQCLARLPEPERALVSARYEAGASVRDMAAASDRSADALSMHLFRLRKRLAECIEGVLSEQERQAEEGI